MCKNTFLSLFLLYFIIVDILTCNTEHGTASSNTTTHLLLSHITVVKQENDTFNVFCKEDTGATVKWKNWKYHDIPLHGHPSTRFSIHGAQLTFLKIKKSDAGVYKCVSKNEEAEFELNVQGKSETSSENPKGGSIVIQTNNVKPWIDEHAGNVQSTPPTSIDNSATTTTTTTPRATRATRPTPRSFTTKGASKDRMEFKDTPERQYFDYGVSRLTLRCEVLGGIARWQVDEAEPKNDKYVIGGDGLLINNVTLDDQEHNYTCQAYNQIAGDYINRPIKLIFKHGPRLPQQADNYRSDKTHYIEKQILYAHIGRILTLECEVKAEPPPKFKWYGSDNRKKIGEVKNVNEYKSEIKLVMKEKSFGQYKCEASNEKGKLEIQYEIVEAKQPSKPKSLTLKEAQSNALVLEIEGPDEEDQPKNDRLNTTGFRVEYKLNYTDDDWIYQDFSLSEDKTYTVTDLQSNTSYEVRAATENLAGLSEHTNIVIFETLPNAANRKTMSIISLSCFTMGLFYLGIMLLINKNIH